MAKHGTVGEYCQSQETWSEYVERLELYFVANDISDAAKKRAILLNVCGISIYKLVRNLAAPTKPSELEYDALLQLIAKHVAPKPSVILERFRFHSRVHQLGEKIADFVAELCRLSEHCAFGEARNEMLRDRLVCGASNTNIQQKLLAESDDLTLEKALTTALAMETAEQNALTLQAPPQQPTTTGDVHAMERQREGAETGPSGQPRCTRCGGREHSKQNRHFKQTICHKCKRRGHLTRMCRDRQATGSARRSRTPSHTQQTA